MPIICSKCNHARQETETCPATQCPACKADYANIATIKKPNTTWMWFVAAAFVAGAVAQSELFSSRESSSVGTAKSYVQQGAQQQASATLPAPNQGQSSGQPEVTLYSATWCGYCDAARRFFKKNNIAFTEHDIEKTTAGAEGYKKHGGGGMQVIVVGEEKINGFKAGEARDLDWCALLHPVWS
jgi:glutaredoxin